MHRRYTIHRDGDLLVEDLDAQGKAIAPEPVPPEDRLPVEVVVMAADTLDARAQLLDLLELAFGMEAEQGESGEAPDKPPTPGN
ncbi:MAG: hypothetical protein ACKVPX_10520 [Myxococcaceae bacterium]